MLFCIHNTLGPDWLAMRSRCGPETGLWEALSQINGGGSYAFLVRKPFAHQYQPIWLIPSPTLLQQFLSKFFYLKPS